MLLLLFYTQKRITPGFVLFAGTCLAAGIAIEITCIKTGILFGDYKYGKIPGPSIGNVPLIVCINWFIIIYCAGTTIQMILNKIIDRISMAKDGPPPTLKALSVIVDGASLAVLFRWLMEPAATKLGLWQWAGDGTIPFYNYICWLILSALLLCVFYYCRFEKQNRFAINLLLIQAMFFLLVRTFL